MRHSYASDFDIHISVVDMINGPDYARGEGLMSSSDEEDDDEDDNDEDEESEEGRCTCDVQDALSAIMV